MLPLNGISCQLGTVDCRALTDGEESMKRKTSKRRTSQNENAHAVQRALAKEHTAIIAREADAAAFSARRRRAGEAFKRRLLEKAMTAAGIDVNAIARRQQRDQSSILAYAAKRKAAIIRAGPG